MDQQRDFAIQELLRDLGWLPSDLNCEEKKRLAEEYLNATTVWFELAGGLRLVFRERLRRHFTVLEKGEHEARGQAIEDARLKAAGARVALEAHIATHSC